MSKDSVLVSFKEHWERIGNIKYWLFYIVSTSISLGMLFWATNHFENQFQISSAFINIICADILLGILCFFDTRYKLSWSGYINPLFLIYNVAVICYSQSEPISIFLTHRYNNIMLLGLVAMLLIIPALFVYVASSDSRSISDKASTIMIPFLALAWVLQVTSSHRILAVIAVLVAIITILTSISFMASGPIAEIYSEYITSDFIILTLLLVYLFILSNEAAVIPSIVVSLYLVIILNGLMRFKFAALIGFAVILIYSYLANILPTVFLNSYTYMDIARSAPTSLSMTWVCNTLGVVPELILLLAIIIIVINCFRSGRSLQYSRIRRGVGAILVLLTFLNVAGNLNILPVSGINFPFFSFNFGSVFLYCSALGIVIGTSNMDKRLVSDYDNIESVQDAADLQEIIDMLDCSEEYHVKKIPLIKRIFDLKIWTPEPDNGYNEDVPDDITSLSHFLDDSDKDLIP